jgi:hypothetical protein
MTYKSNTQNIKTNQTKEHNAASKKTKNNKWKREQMFIKVQRNLICVELEVLLQKQKCKKKFIDPQRNAETNHQRRIKWKKTSDGRNSRTELESGANKNKAPKVMEEWSW